MCLSRTSTGIFHQYYFKTGSEKEKMFACDWAHACSKDPIRYPSLNVYERHPLTQSQSGKMEYYLCCGMNGKLDGEGIRIFGRPALNLVIALDISGSMCSPFRAGTITPVHPKRSQAHNSHNHPQPQTKS